MRVACVYGFESIMKYVRNFLARQFVLVCSACINNNISMCIRSKYHLKNKNALMMAHSIQKRLPQLICSHLYSHEVYHKTITICIKFIRRQKKTYKRPVATFKWFGFYLLGCVRVYVCFFF